MRPIRKLPIAMDGCVEIRDRFKDIIISGNWSLPLASSRTRAVRGLGHVLATRL